MLYQVPKTPSDSLRIIKNILKHTITINVSDAHFCSSLGNARAASPPKVAPFGEGSSFRLGGYCTSFDVVIFFCGVCALLTQFWWTENYGSSEGVWIGFGRAVAVTESARACRYFSS